MPEWTGQQQVLLLCHSVAFGGCLGLVFDFFNVPSKSSRRHRLMTFLCDVVFFAVAALATFFFSLAVMDGRMHPLLFIGSSLGVILEHLLIGRLISRLLYLCGRFFYRLIRRLEEWITLMLRVCLSVISHAVSALRSKMQKNIEKTRKKPQISEKNS